MTPPNTFNCLVLTPGMTPHAHTHWWETICLLYTNKIHVLEEYEETVSSPSVTIHIPAVATLRKPVPRTKNDVKFSRSNVYARDQYRCQYCGMRKDSRHLTYDHVIPRKQGGKTTWENIVSACTPCNLKKDDMTPEQAGMRLLRKPVRPMSLPMTPFVLHRHVPTLWLPYLEGVNTLRAV